MTEPELEPEEPTYRRRRGRSPYDRPAPPEPESPVRVTKLTRPEAGSSSRSRRALTRDGRVIEAESSEAAGQWDERAWRRAP